MVLIVLLSSLCLFGVYHALTRRISLAEQYNAYLVYPLLKISTFIMQPLTRARAYITTNQTLAATLQQYKARYNTCQAELIKLQALYTYDQHTHELRTFAQRYNVLYAQLAHILVKHFDEHEHFFLLDAGTKKGIAVDNVVVYKNCLVGRISQVFDYYSKATLITDKSCKIAAYCTHTSTQGIHEGLNNPTMTNLGFVNHLEKLELQDLVLSSGEGLVFPRGFGLGRVNTRERDGFHYTCTLEPLIDFSQLTYCYIIQKGNEQVLKPELPIAEALLEEASSLPDPVSPPELHAS